MTSYWAGSGPPPLPPSFLIGIDHRALTPHTRVVVYVFVVTTNRLINSLPFPAKRDLRLILLLPRKLFRSRSSPAAAASRLYVILRDSTRHCAFYLLYPRSLSLSIERISSSLYLLIHPLVLKLFVRKVTRSIKKKRKEKIPREKKETRSRRRRQRGSNATRGGGLPGKVVVWVRTPTKTKAKLGHLGGILARVTCRKTNIGRPSCKPPFEITGYSPPPCPPPCTPVVRYSGGNSKWRRGQGEIT